MHLYRICVDDITTFVMPARPWKFFCSMHRARCALLEVFLNAFAKGLAKLLPKTLCDGIMNKDINK